ncbi:hypothetical protein [Paraburkholderia youngii]|uniref:hypothetical protein n=1 Tax=Paraburkholderia youngii TaxID=2782701 RepID=UPI003D208292
MSVSVLSLWRRRRTAANICSAGTTALLAAALTACSTTLPSSDPNAPVISWTLRDEAAVGPADTFGASADPIQLTAGKQYTIALLADNPGGVKQIVLDGSGTFICSTPPISGVVYTAPDKLPVSLPHQQSDLTPDSMNQVVTHTFLLLADFDVTKLSCGIQCYSGPTPACQEYFAYSGTLNLTGSASNYYGKTGNGQLQINY